MNRRDSTLSDLVQQRIETLGIKQTEYADSIGVQRSTLHQVITGKSRLPKDPFRRLLAEDLGISVLDIFVMAGELRPEDVAPVAPTLPARTEALVSLARQVDWDHRPDQYIDLTRQLNRWVMNDRARQAAESPPPRELAPVD